MENKRWMLKAPPSYAKCMSLSLSQTIPLFKSKPKPRGIKV